MTPDTYTEREWNFLTQYGEHDWPEDWNDRRDDRQRWEPAVDLIARRHALSMTKQPDVGAGSNLACILDDTVIKIYARHNPIRFPREVEALQLLEHYPAARTPRLIAEGEVDVEGMKHSYIIMERLRGRTFRAVWGEMTLDDRIDIIRQLVPVVRAVHDVPTESLTSFGSGVGEWIERMKRRAGLAHGMYAAEWPDYLLEQLEPLLKRLLPVLETSYSLHLLSGDVIGGNILVDRRDERWELTGLIDFGDAEVGPVEYELISICQKACRSDRSLIETFLSCYGIAFPFTEPTRSAIRLYSLLHGFPMMRWAHEDHPTIPSLEKLIDTQNGISDAGDQNLTI